MMAALALSLLACKKASRDDNAAPAPAPAQHEFAKPVVIASEQPGPSAVAVDAEYVYWTHAGTGLVRKAPRSGGPAVTLYESGSEVGGRSIALGADDVYFNEAFSIRRVPKSGGAVADVGTLAYLPGYVTADAEGAYSVAEREVVRYARDGTRARLAGGFELWDIAVDDTHVYWVERNGVKRAPKSGGDVEVLARGVFRFCKIALSEIDVYWGDAVLESVFAVPKKGGAARFVSAAWDIATKDLAVDRDGSVWVLQSGGSLERVDPATGDVTTVALGLERGGSADHYLGFALAGSEVFVASGGSSLVGSGPVHVDLTKPDPKLPTYRYGGEVLRLPTALPPRALVQNRGEIKVASVWFQGTGTTMQDSNNATRWVDQLDQILGDDLRAGKLGVRIIAVTSGIDQAQATARANAVKTAILQKLGGTPRVATSTEAPSTRRGDVRVTLDIDDVLSKMAPASDTASRVQDR